MPKKNLGSIMDDFLKQEDIFEDAQAHAVKEVVAWQLAEAMREKNISKNKMAQLLKTSRTQVDRLLIRKTTSRSQACNAPPPWSDAASTSNWCSGTGTINSGSPGGLGL